MNYALLYSVPVVVLWLVAAVCSVLSMQWGRENYVMLRRSALRRIESPPAPGTSPAAALVHKPVLSSYVGATRVPAPLAGGGTTTPATLSLAVLPAWSEQDVRATDGSPAPQHDNLCGEVAVAAIVAAVHAVPTNPGDHRTHAHGLTGSALTTGPDLVAMLQHCSIGASSHTVGWPMADALIRSRLFEGCYCIVLISPDWVGYVAHWVVPVSRTAAGYTVFDPWAGGYRAVGDGDMVGWYDGEVVTTSAHPHYQMAGLAMPPL